MRLFREEYMEYIVMKKPKHICVGFLSKQEMAYLVYLMHAKVINHLYFLDCDPVECWVLIEWNLSSKQRKNGEKDDI